MKQIKAIIIILGVMAIIGIGYFFSTSMRDLRELQFDDDAATELFDFSELADVESFESDDIELERELAELESLDFDTTDVNQDSSSDTQSDADLETEITADANAEASIEADIAELESLDF